MFRFFTTAKWAVWAWLGSVVILSSLWVQVQIDVRINEWFGEFYDMVQNCLLYTSPSPRDLSTSRMPSSA